MTTTTQRSLHALGLTGAAQTALLPLWARAVEAQRKDRLFGDPAATRWRDALASQGIKMPDIAKAGSSQAGLAIRTAVFDAWVRDWAMQNASGVVVDLGIGLCTRAARLRLPGTDWLATDEPAVLSVRKRLINCDAAFERERTLPVWWRDEAIDDVVSKMDEIVEKRPVCFVAEGLLMYLHEQTARRLLAAIADRFTDAVLMADVLAAWQARGQRWHDTLKLTDGRYRWGRYKPTAWLASAGGWRVDASTGFSDPRYTATYCRIEAKYRLATTVLSPLFGDYRILRASLR